MTSAYAYVRVERRCFPKVIVVCMMFVHVRVFQCCLYGARSCACPSMLFMTTTVLSSSCDLHVYPPRSLSSTLEGLPRGITNIGRWPEQTNPVGPHIGPEGPNEKTRSIKFMSPIRKTEEYWLGLAVSRCHVPVLHA